MTEYSSLGILYSDGSVKEIALNGNESINAELNQYNDITISFIPSPAEIENFTLDGGPLNDMPNVLATEEWREFSGIDRYFLIVEGADIPLVDIGYNSPVQVYYHF